MSLPLSITQKQPAHWPRKRIEECFSISTMLTSSQLNFNPGDILLRMKNGHMTAEIVGEEQPEASRNIARMRSNGILLPQLMMAMINHPHIQSSMESAARMGNGSLGLMNAGALRPMEIAVPDPQTQAMMVEAIEKSHHFLQEHAANLRKQADTIDKMSDAILHQVLIAQADLKESLTWVSQALMPWRRMGPSSTTVQEYSASDAAKAGADARFVRMEDHQDEIARLQGRIREMEGETTPQRPRARP